MDLLRAARISRVWISNIQIENCSSIRKIDIALGEPTVFIGPNNAARPRF